VDRTSGAVTATALGRAAIVVRSGGRSTEAHLSVAPRAWVATQQHESGNGGPLGVFLMELDGSGRQPLAEGLGSAWGLQHGFGWSPDGSDLVIARGDSVDLVSPGSEERRLIMAGGPVSLGARFSRDGEWIYFGREGRLHRVRRDGSGMELLLDDQGFLPSPSHDGRSVVYSSSSRTPGESIRVLDIATGADRTYGDRDYLVRGTNAAWSPTEDLIAYASNAVVGVIRSDGTGEQILARDAGHVGWLEWSPDGRWLLVSEGTAPVLLFEVQTGLRMPLATLASYGATAWRP
jgi:Tol biopolymer transport system component